MRAHGQLYEGLDLGKPYPRQRVFPLPGDDSDILLFLKKEKERLGKDFDPDRYIYFMPEAEGPCRFGMYNKYSVSCWTLFRTGAPQNRVITRNSYAWTACSTRSRPRSFVRSGTSRWSWRMCSIDCSGG